MREHHSSIHAFDLVISPGEPSASDSPLSAAPSASESLLSAAPSVPAAARAEPCTFVRLSPSVVSSMSTLPGFPGFWLGEAVVWVMSPSLASTVRSLASHLHQH